MSTLLALVFVVGTMVSIGRIRFTHLPATVAILIFGLAIGTLTPSNKPDVKDSGPNSGLLYDLYLCANIPPEVLLQILLPLLVFEGAFNTDTHVFKRKLRSILLLAIPGVILSTVLTALVPRYFFSAITMDWRNSLLFGAMLSATDPVSVVAVLRESGASEKLRAVVDGEALLNDGVGIVLFTLLQAQLNPSVVAVTVRLSVLSPVLGAVIGLVCAYIAGRMFNQPQAESFLTLVACFTAFAVADSAEASGILATVIAGLFLSHWGDGKFSPPALKMIHFMWDAIANVCNLLVFAISGIVIAYIVTESKDFGTSKWADLFVLYISVHVVRFVMIFALTPLGVEGSWQELTMMAMSGLRGSVGLVLALSFRPDDPKVRNAFLFHMGGIAALTLLINGSVAKGLLHLLGLIVESSEDHIRRTNATAVALPLGKEDALKLIGVPPNNKIITRALRYTDVNTILSSDNDRARLVQRMDAAVDDWFENGHVLPGDKRVLHAALHEWAEHGIFKNGATLTGWIILREVARVHDEPGAEEIIAGIEEQILTYEVREVATAKEQLATFAALHTIARVIRSQGLHPSHELILMRQISCEMCEVSSQGFDIGSRRLTRAVTWSRMDSHESHGHLHQDQLSVSSSRRCGNYDESHDGESLFDPHDMHALSINSEMMETAGRIA